VVSAADLERDEAPPASGPRRRVLVEVAVPPAAAENHAEPDVLAEVAAEVCGETWALFRGLSPLQGAWLAPGVGQVGSALMTAARWRSEGERPVSATLRARWHELVPGHAAMGCLVGLMVDRICATR
jgi:hypothetical protein